MATSLNLNGLNGESWFDTSAFSGDDSRCKKYGWFINPRTSSGDKIIVIGQITGDQSLNALEGNSIYSWVATKVAQMAATGDGSKVLFKPHPLEKTNMIREVGAPLFTGNMDDVLKVAERVVTYSSTAGVDAWLSAVPATSDSPVSMIFRHQDLVGNKNPLNLEELRQWLNELSFRQFRLEEIRDGTAWEILGNQVLRQIGFNQAPHAPNDKAASLVDNGGPLVA